MEIYSNCFFYLTFYASSELPYIAAHSTLLAGTGLREALLTLLYICVTPHTILCISNTQNTTLLHCAAQGETHPCRPSGKITTPKLIFLTPCARARASHPFIFNTFNFNYLLIHSCNVTVMMIQTRNLVK